MATNASGEFEEALKRLEEIVQKLEKENVALDESVALFKEGKGLATKCERLLKDAQTSIDVAARGDAAESAPARASSAATQLFANGGVDDADPDL
ncbi:MAG: exodeoxyribonuclease VII small subunit [Candidatus Eremiobacteraeota bacterium]|nr:exodeoxyribonuclease VII small subunit [Candidatus Eremiobacteraeota bacterium]